MSKVYTKTGDGGTTSLVGGERVSKADQRVEAYGTVDELSAHLALLGDMVRAEERAEGHGVELFEWLSAAVERVQVELMTVEALLATGRGGEGKVKGLAAEAVARLEAEIDAMSEGLPPVGGFTLPGGHPVVSQCHVCRTVCRRAERAAVRAADAHSDATYAATALANAPVPTAAGYLNRLSDWLYTVGRKAAVTLGVKEIYWIS